MELLDLVNAKGEPINKTIVRGSKGMLGKGEYIHATHIWIQDKNGKFLIQKVSKEKGALYGTTGGLISSGQNHIEGAIREIKEEIGIDITTGELRFIDKVIHDGEILINVFHVNKDFSQTKFELQKEEVDSIHWLTLEEIENLKHDNLLRATSVTTLDLIKRKVTC